MIEEVYASPWFTVPCVELCFGGGSFSGRNFVVQQVAVLHQCSAVMKCFVSSNILCAGNPRKIY